MLEALWKAGDPTESIIKCSGIQLTRGDFKTLQDSQWVGGTIISSYMGLINERSMTDLGQTTVFV